MIFPSGVAKKCVRTRTRHRVPPASSAIRRTRHRRRLAGSAIRRTIRRALLRTRNPTRPGETPSGRTAVMGCPRLVRPPLQPRRSKLSNTKNTDERRAENKDGREKVEVCRLFLRLCVVIQSTVTVHVYKERLDFPCNRRLDFSCKIDGWIHVTNPN
jgi:hypothetical protein